MGEPGSGNRGREPPRRDARPGRAPRAGLRKPGRKARGKHCDGIAGIVEEGKAIMEEDFDEATMDACLIGAAQRAEHYEIAAYGTIVAWARAMGHAEATKLWRKRWRRKRPLTKSSPRSPRAASTTRLLKAPTPRRRWKRSRCAGADGVIR